VLQAEVYPDQTISKYYIRTIHFGYKTAILYPRDHIIGYHNTNIRPT